MKTISKPFTEIIIPTYGQEDYTCRCFDSILEHTSDYRLVWLDNASSPESQKKANDSFRKHPVRMPIWLDKNTGFVGGVNAALRILLDTMNTDSKYIVIQNNDTEVSEGWLEGMISVMERDESVGIVGPVTDGKGSSFQEWDRACPQKSPDGTIASKQKILSVANGDQFKKVDVVTFFCAAMRSTLFGKIGLLDEDFGIGLWDDHDLCLRAKKAHFGVAVALGSYVYHACRTTFKATMSEGELKAAHERNRRLFIHKHNK